MRFIIKGTHCPACKRLIERRVGQIKGIISVDVNFESGDTQITSLQEISKEEIKEALKEMEYSVA